MVTKTRAAGRHESIENTCFPFTIWKCLPWPWPCARSLEGDEDGWADLPDPDRRPIHLPISGTSSPRGSAVYFLSVWVYLITARSKRALAEIRNSIEMIQFRMLFIKAAIAFFKISWWSILLIWKITRLTSLLTWKVLGHCVITRLQKLCQTPHLPLSTKYGRIFGAKYSKSSFFAAKQAYNARGKECHVCTMQAWSTFQSHWERMVST